MKFDDAKEKLSTIHKLHTAREFEGETIFYKRPYSAKRLIILSDGKNVFDLEKVSHISLSEVGLLVQYKQVDKNIMLMVIKKY